jgi:hypothetical protein
MPARNLDFIRAILGIRGTLTGTVRSADVPTPAAGPATDPPGAPAADQPPGPSTPASAPPR